METIEDNDLGTILIKRNSRAKHITARRKDGFIAVTVPSFTSFKQIESALLQLKPKLLKLPIALRYQFIEGEQLSTLTFKVSIEQNFLNNIYHKLDQGVLRISIPKNLDIQSNDVQDKIRAIVEIHLRSEAKYHLPKLVKALSEKHGFKYTSTSIQKSRTRWGSCSSTKKINLSYWCMMLPRHLIEFIILHELCHTIEMNHGQRFWNLLDSVTSNRAKELTAELRKCRIEL